MEPTHCFTGNFLPSDLALLLLLRYEMLGMLFIFVLIKVSGCLYPIMFVSLVSFHFGFILHKSREIVLDVILIS